MVCPKQRPLRRTTCTDIVATAKAGTLSFCVTRRKRRPLTEFRKLAAKAAWKRRRPAPLHKHPVLRGPNREIIQAERSPRSLLLSSTRLFPDSSPGGWVGEKFSLNHSTDEPKASAGELQPSWSGIQTWLVKICTSESLTKNATHS